MLLTTDNITDVLRKNEEILKKDFGIRSLTLYGSYAKGTAVKESDIDLFYEMQDGIHMTLRRLSRLELFIRDLVRVSKVELVNRKQANPLVVQNAIQDAITIF
jgi:uncharacterized protein